MAPAQIGKFVEEFLQLVTEEFHNRLGRKINPVIAAEKGMLPPSGMLEFGSMRLEYKVLKDFILLSNEKDSISFGYCSKNLYSRENCTLEQIQKLFGFVTSGNEADSILAAWETETEQDLEELVSILNSFKNIALQVEQALMEAYRGNIRLSLAGENNSESKELILLSGDELTYRLHGSGVHGKFKGFTIDFDFSGEKEMDPIAIGFDIWRFDLFLQSFLAQRDIKWSRLYTMALLQELKTRGIICETEEELQSFILSPIGA
jgi:hypothetical protein